jgi:hypothetical protein
MFHGRFFLKVILKEHQTEESLAAGFRDPSVTEALSGKYGSPPHHFDFVFERTPPP